MFGREVLPARPGQCEILHCFANVLRVNTSMRHQPVTRTIDRRAEIFLPAVVDEHHTA